MAQLHKRRRVFGHGGAGPFHAPQKPGRTNHVSRKAVPAVAERITQVKVDELAQQREKRQQRRSIFHRTFGRLTGRAGA